MRRVILESPYAGDVEKNIAYAKEAVKDCLKRGESPIASHLLYTQPGILDDSMPLERRLGISAGLAWLGVAEAMVVYEDNGLSRGVIEAIQQALRYKIPVEYRKLYGTNQYSKDQSGASGAIRLLKG